MTGGVQKANVDIVGVGVCDGLRIELEYVYVVDVGVRAEVVEGGSGGGEDAGFPRYIYLPPMQPLNVTTRRNRLSALVIK